MSNVAAGSLGSGGVVGSVGGAGLVESVVGGGSLGGALGAGVVGVAGGVGAAPQDEGKRTVSAWMMLPPENPQLRRPLRISKVGYNKK